MITPFNLLYQMWNSEFSTMRIAVVSAISIVGIISLPLTTNVGAVPSYRKDSYSNENTYSKDKSYDQYPSMRYTGDGGYSGSRRHTSYGGNTGQGGYVKYPPLKEYSGYEGFGSYQKATKAVSVPSYPMYIPYPFSANKKNTDTGPGNIPAILAILFLSLLLKFGGIYKDGGIYKKEENSSFVLINNQRVFGVIL